ncbi:MAG TPA: cupin domain-containing protein [Fibrobacteria bacterium]|nr:cupin domain-containing protein [Fibrobacteria bacterium]HOX50288.1 cupin domain-containing protein [Fibrobacteria bacterium]
MSSDQGSSQDWIERLGLSPHPEGGWYRETHRSEDRIRHESLGDRSAFTSILFLLEHPQVSHLHRIDAEELWNWHAGSDLVVHVEERGRLVAHRLGPGSGVFQLVVPAGVWFASEVVSPGSWALVGCVVAPGFEFSGFQLGSRKELLARFPLDAQTVKRLSLD